MDGMLLRPFGVYHIHLVRTGQESQFQQRATSLRHKE
jgi:hypothetical protein